MATETKIAGTGANVATSGTIAWGVPANITSDNAVYSTASTSVESFAVSNYLRGTNFGFNVPSGSTINGILVELQLFADAYLPAEPVVITASQCKIVKGGSAAGTLQSPSFSDITDTESLLTYGSASNLWGTTWSAADINSSNFGFDFQVSFDDAISLGNACNVDYIKITVDYTPPINGNMLLMFD